MGEYQVRPLAMSVELKGGCALSPQLVDRDPKLVRNSISGQIKHNTKRQH